MHRVGDKAVDTDTEENECNISGDRLQIEHKDAIALILVRGVGDSGEDHEESEDGDDGRSQNLGVLVLIDGFSANINNDRVALKNEHGNTQVTKYLVDIDDFQVAWDLLIIMHFLAKIAKDHHHSYGGHADAENGKVAQEGVRLNEADRKRRDGHKKHVDL